MESKIVFKVDLCADQVVYLRLFVLLQLNGCHLIAPKTSNEIGNRR